MKRSERHHLKKNAVAVTVARARELYDQNRRQVTIGILIAVVVALGIGGYLIWRQQTTAAASAMLADALEVSRARVVPPTPPAEPGTPDTPATPATPLPPPPGSYPSERARHEAALPKFLAAADRYPSTEPGIAARYHAAATLAALGRTADAEQRYREVIERASDGLYGEMARLGLASVHIAAGKYDDAITTAREMSSDQTTDLPTDALLMQLGRAYARAGKAPEAVRAYTRVVDEFPQSLYVSDAKQEIANLQAAGK